MKPDITTMANDLENIKKHDYTTGRNEVGAAVSSVAAEIQNLVSELNNITKHSQ